MGLGLNSRERVCHSAVITYYSAQVNVFANTWPAMRALPLLVYIAFSLLFLKANVDALKNKATLGLLFLGISVCRAPPRQAPRPGHERMFTLTAQAQANGKRGGPLLRGPRRHRSQRGTTSSCSSSRARRPSTRSARSRGRRPAAAATSGVPPCLGPGGCYGLLVIWHCLCCAACLRLPLNLDSRVSPSVRLWNLEFSQHSTWPPRFLEAH